MLETTVPRTVFDVLADFLATHPDTDQIFAFRLPPELEARAAELLRTQREGDLTVDEQYELYDFIRADDLMTLLKAKLTRALPPQP